jgi:hypothetical protein
MYRPVQQQQQVQQSVRPALFSQKNRETLESLLTQDFQSRMGPLNAKQQDRLGRTVEYYMDEVYEVQGEKPLATLNREILRATAADFGKYLQRKDAVQSAPEAPIKTVMNEQLFQETSKRFEMLQNERQEQKALPPPMPDFRISLDDEGPTSAELFEKAKRIREQEALRVLTTQKDAYDRVDAGLVKRNNADDTFRINQQMQNRATDLALQEKRTQPKPMDMPLIVPPDRRELMLPANITLNPDSSMMPVRPFEITKALSPREMGQGNANPTITEPEFSSPQKLNLQQDILIRQDNIVSYREIENNLFVYSGDRDWLKNIRENRYSFTVNFDPANNGQSLPASPASQQKFKNITRIELVKAIMPAEAIDVLITQDLSNGSAIPVTTYQNNILSFPFITVQIQELDGNNYGTDNFLDRSFGVLQYDANWYSDPDSLTNSQDSRGYLAMIPKFMKCQRVYHPTPMATLQKMTISLVRPDGNLISSVTDTLDIYNIYGGNNFAVTASLPDFTTSLYSGAVATDPYYFFIETTKYFSRFQISVGDRIQIAGYNYNTTGTTAAPVLTGFSTWVNSTQGHLVAAIGYIDPATGTYYDGANSVGFANVIIIQARFADPTDGSVSLSPFTGITSALYNQYNNLLLPRRLINQNRQIQLVFRIITREMDSVGQLRPDNM